MTERAIASRALWSPGEHGSAPAGEMPALVEQLRARLGAAAVYGIAPVSGHRPERAWRRGQPFLPANEECPHSPAHRAFSRPLWLLEQPEALDSRRGRPLRDGALELLEGPERVESGWWDGADIQRDYYMARSAAGSRLWIFRECTGARGWFLHGVFG